MANKTPENRIKMKKDYSLTTGRILIKNCYYTVDKELAERLVEDGIAYKLNVWYEGSVKCKQFVDYN